MDNEIAIRSSIPQMVEEYEKFGQDIRVSMGSIQNAQNRLRGVFSMTHGPGIGIRMSHRDYDLEDWAAIMKEVKKSVWRVLVDRMELRRVMSIKRMAELDKQIDKGEGLPDITVQNLYAMIDSTLEQLPVLIEEAAREVFDWLRPGSYYKTNQVFEIGRKVVISYAVELNWAGTSFRVDYNREQNLRALDNVFMMMDGKGTIKTYQGPLGDAINQSGPVGVGETDYFKFKCYKNRNLHLEFKRLDLVEKLNAVAGGARLKGPVAS